MLSNSAHAAPLPLRRALRPFQSTSTYKISAMGAPFSEWLPRAAARQGEEAPASVWMGRAPCTDAIPASSTTSGSAEKSWHLSLLWSVSAATASSTAVVQARRRHCSSTHEIPCQLAASYTGERTGASCRNASAASKHLLRRLSKSLRRARCSVVSWLSASR